MPDNIPVYRSRGALLHTIYQRIFSELTKRDIVEEVLLVLGSSLYLYRQLNSFNNRTNERTNREYGHDETRGCGAKELNRHSNGK